MNGGLVLGLLALLVLAGAASAQTVTLYADCNYQGKSWTFSANVADFTKYSGLNDKVSSVKVSAGYAATLYEHTNYGGKYEHFIADKPCLVGSWIGNDVASSLSVMPRTPWAVARHVWPTDDRALVSADLDRIKDLGGKYIRTDFWWYAVEPSKDAFDANALAYYKWLVDTAASKGLGVVVILSNAPQWAKDLYTSGQLSAFYAQFKEYAARVAQEVGSGVYYYQVWNEPNHVNDFVNSAGDVQLFINGRAGIAQHDASFKTIVNVLVDGHDSPFCPNWQCDLDYYMNNGAKASVDILAIDHYPGTWSEGDWGGNILNRLFSKGKQHGKAVAVLEAGYSTAGCAPAWNSETGQESWANDQLQKFRNKIRHPTVNQGVKFEFATWFKLDDPNSNYDNCWADPVNTIEAHFGVVRTDRSLKPAYDDVKRQFGQF